MQRSVFAIIIPLIVLVILVPSQAQTPRVQLGVDTLVADPALLRGRRVGLVTNQAGVSRDGQFTADVLASIPGIQITALFAPEHGLDGSREAREVFPTIPGRTSVYSLYGGSFRPTREMLQRIDVLVVDLQDVGVRPFTYASTMALVMSAARQASKAVIVLDRPNPLGGHTVDGPVLEPELRSFIGMYPIPYVHGLTLGELALLYNQAFGIGANLTVIPMQGWSRSMVWADTGLPWPNPSPGLLMEDIAPYYAATGPIDGTNLWNGVATDSRFRVILAPWIDAPRLAERLNRHHLPGVQFTPSAIPHPITGQIWQGVRLHIADPRVFRPSTTIVYILAEIRRMHGSKLTFARPRRGSYLFDLVWGTAQVRLAISRGEPAEAIVARWQPGLQRFRNLRERFLRYH